ncbi:SAM-dependent methyltransferase TehB [Gemella cuniculi]|uniref:SAM-dependent methyltransferase TehB n=1 Tax=Gemella cuniculi TaxID=150240 RepID=UPI000428E0AD|nr:SAM-dependent methyltransferase TehB [Gemella cuniculi]
MENNLVCFKRTPNWTALSLPKEFREKYSTKTGVWSKLIILKGKLKIVFLTETGESIKDHTFSKKDNEFFIQPNSFFRIIPLTTDLNFFFEFYCEVKDYFSNKYDLNPAHPEIVKAMNFISPCKTLDLGAGQGKNALYLSTLGFNVTAVDNNAQFLQYLANISLEEKLNLSVFKHDINEANIRNTYDFIFSTDVFMFLNPTRITSIIHNIQEQTNIGGYNLIVSAMSMPNDKLSQIPFPFTFIENELKNYYKGWDVVIYKEELDSLSKVDDNEKYTPRFVTLLAKKI